MIRKRPKKESELDVLTKKERTLRKVAIVVVFLATYFFFVKLLFL